MPSLPTRPTGFALAHEAGSRRETVRPVDVDLRASHIPQTQPYGRCPRGSTRPGGPDVDPRRPPRVPPAHHLRLLDADLPVHPCLTLVANGEQAMTQKIGRRLITMQKLTMTLAPRILSARPLLPQSDPLRNCVSGSLSTLSGSLDKRERKKRERKGRKRKNVVNFVTIRDSPTGPRVLCLPRSVQLYRTRFFF